MQRLFPTLDLAAQEYVLVQAWKKSASYIRHHNWFSDTLELDRAAANLPEFLSVLSEKMRSGSFETSGLKLVPAPKSQRWHVDSAGLWQPQKTGAAKIRPLAHVSLSDQVAATAVLLCLSERVETIQGDPRRDYRSPAGRRSVMSYGNRLFCDPMESGHLLVHRWGSSKLYRAFFQDYRVFLNRPETVAASLTDKDQSVLIVQTDLKQFYDRVTPEALHAKIRQLQQPGDDEAFFELARTILDWGWSEADQKQVSRYKQQAGIPQFERVALPQGLVAAGFFSNIVMLDFDAAVLSAFEREIAAGVWLRDACRYVDDIRLTISTAAGVTPADAQERVMEWLGNLLDQDITGLEVAPDKTTTASFGGEEQPLVRQSRKMERIQSAISGGFDASGGEEVIQAIEALVRSQASLNGSDAFRPEALKAVPDVKDETIGRFAAGRFRTTFRSLRPLLDDRPFKDPVDVGDETYRRTRLSQAELDDEAHAFALMLIDRWITDPSNVRLLRIALDLWPSPQILSEILKLFEPYLAGDIGAFAPRRIAYYCLAEILRAGATETGFIEDPECVPANVNLPGYRQILLKCAVRIVEGKARNAPWYVVQQALLFITVHDPALARPPRLPRANVTYWRMIAFLQGDHSRFADRDFAITAVVARRSFLSKERAIDLIRMSLTPGRFSEIAARDIEFARDVYRAVEQEVTVGPGIAEDLGITAWSSGAGMQSLQQYVHDHGPLNVLRNELGVLSFAEKFLEEAKRGAIPSVVTPSTIQVSLEGVGNYAVVKAISIRSAETTKTYRSIYAAPTWADETQHWRFQLGYLLRFILTARVDFSLPVRRPSWKEAQPLYRPTRGHWFQRQYGFYNGHEAFGDDWLPISQFTQDLLFSLLIWPGCRHSQDDGDKLSLETTLANVAAAVASAHDAIGSATGLLMIKVAAPIPGTRKKDRPLRACVVQSIMPEEADFSASDLEMLHPSLRRKHRKHLSTALAAVEKMLDLRETHKPDNKRLDWLILPELSVHPADVATHLVPFARAFKTAILAGMVYEHVVPGQPLVNSALWVIPRMVEGQGLQTIIRRQGKQHLSPVEQPFNVPTEKIIGFRPCQWLVGYEWSPDAAKDPLWLTGSVCYDATDLKLASDLRDISDVFAIPALNRDVGTFDQMAQALHYHMFQLVLVANNGAFGGSNAHMPKGGPHKRQVFHTHGQPQATISFFEIDDIEDMKSRRQHGLSSSFDWKYPPAGC